jgi:hypothetical protein
MTDTTEDHALDPDIEAIRARAAAADAAAQPIPPAESTGTVAASEAATASPVPTFTQELAGMMFALGNMAAMRFPSLKAIYTKENCDHAAGDIAPALEQLGWTFTGGAGMVYIKAGGALIMLTLATRDAVMHDLALEKKALAPNPAPGSAGAVKPADASVEAPIAPGPGVHAQVALYGLNPSDS